MESKYVRQLRIPLSLCGADARLSLWGAFSLCMDLASEHAQDIGVGMADMQKKDLFWLTVRTRIRFFRRPALMESVTAATWPEKPGPARCNRDYALTSGGETLLLGKTEWTVMDTAAGRIHPAKGVYPAELTQAITDETVWTEPFARISEDFTGCPRVGEYTVRSTDIDLGGHMNNAAYPRALFSLFRAEDLSRRNITDAELNFRSPSYEGDTLSVYSRPFDNGTDLGMFNASGKAVLLARIK